MYRKRPLPPSAGSLHHRIVRPNWIVFLSHDTIFDNKKYALSTPFIQVDSEMPIFGLNPERVDSEIANLCMRTTCSRKGCEFVGLQVASECHKPPFSLNSLENVLVIWCVVEIPLFRATTPTTLTKTST
jgi:hypothetical protein